MKFCSLLVRYKSREKFLYRQAFISNWPSLLLTPHKRQRCAGYSMSKQFVARRAAG